MLVAQSCLTLCDTMDCSPPGSSVHGILQARILEWVAIPFSRGSFLTQELNSGLLHRRQILYHLSHQRSPNCSLVSTKDWGNYSGGSGRRWAIELLENLSLFHFFFVHGERSGPLMSMCTTFLGEGCLQLFLLEGAGVPEPHGVWFLSFMTRDRTCGPCSGSTES